MIELIHTFYAAADAYITNLTPTANNGKTGTMYTGLDPYSGSIYRNLLRFDLSMLEPNITIQKAVLRLYLSTRYQAGAPQQLDIYRLTDAFEETAVTWDNAPRSILTPDYTLVDDNNPNGYIDITMTDLVKDWYITPADNYGIMLQTTELANSLLAFRTREYAESAMWPMLIIEYSLTRTVIYASPVIGDFSYLSTSFVLEGHALETAYTITYDSSAPTAGLAIVEQSQDDDTWAQSTSISLDPGETRTMNVSTPMVYERLSFVNAASAAMTNTVGSTIDVNTNIDNSNETALRYESSNTLLPIDPDTGVMTLAVADTTTIIITAKRLDNFNYFSFEVTAAP
ncbi:DNRLRE domain-containing protein [Dehalobacter sp. 4CP]|uniref:DNRLRE domain-containing protein n=1 Tax=Dehalobacter sp. CP TaxID=2594474 RepID=UPI0039E7D670